MKKYIISVWCLISLFASYTWAGYINKQCFKYCKAIAEAYTTNNNSTFLKYDLKYELHHTWTSPDDYNDKQWKCYFYVEEEGVKKHYQAVLRGIGVRGGGHRASAESKHTIGDIVPIGMIRYERQFLWKKLQFVMYVYVTSLSSRNYSEPYVVQ